MGRSRDSSFRENPQIIHREAMKKNLQFFFENLRKHFTNDCQAKFDTARSQNVGVMGKIVCMPQNW